MCGYSQGQEGPLSSPSPTHCDAQCSVPGEGLCSSSQVKINTYSSSAHVVPAFLSHHVLPSRVFQSPIYCNGSQTC